ncbi:MAG: outer membrane lipoprotein-sorting protein [Bacteroidales bacterium]|nr:outer membrane lipoprotein-sorting protein [Bacteroidales bacterium]MBN2821261.1 outer membrane lipoprotein-sorting protein [Bacteroidales bacterium]
MKTKVKLIIASALLSGVFQIAVRAQDATELIRKADAKMRGEKSSYSVMSMTIVRPTWNRTISFKSWTKGTENSLVYITAPAKEKGLVFLKLDRDMWSWNPQINRMIKLPTSMLSQGWMGSDFTNDDLLNQSSIVVDYTHKILAEETVSGEDCYKIELMPKPDAPVVWGKIIMWVSKAHITGVKTEYYDEDGYLVKSEIGMDFKDMSGRYIPTKFELIPADEEDNKTIVVMENIQFNIAIEDSFFSQQNMKRVR